MMAMRGRVQKEGEVIHIICDRITDHDAMLRSIGRTKLKLTPGRGDGATNGGSPDSRGPGWHPAPRSDYYPPFNKGSEVEFPPIRSHDFH
jgi:error-prone DNA polymerase